MRNFPYSLGLLILLSIKSFVLTAGPAMSKAPIKNETEMISLRDQTDRFLKAVGRADFATIKTLVQNGLSVDTKNDWGITPLCFAIHDKNPHLAYFLLELGASVVEPSGVYESPIIVALEQAEHDSCEILYELLKLHPQKHALKESKRLRWLAYWRDPQIPILEKALDEVEESQPKRTVASRLLLAIFPKASVINEVILAYISKYEEKPEDQKKTQKKYKNLLTDGS